MNTLKKDDLIHQIKQWLADPANNDKRARAALLEQIVREFYNYVKFEQPEGEGLDLRDGPERQSLAKVLDAAIDHSYRMQQL